MCDAKTNFGKQDGVDLRDLMKAQFDNLHTLIDANDKAYNQRFENNTEATKAALASADRAVIKAEAATEKRFDNVNEFRNTLADQQRTFIPKAEAELSFRGIVDRIDKLENGQISNQSKGFGINQGIGWIIGIIGTIIGVVSFIINNSK